MFCDQSYYTRLHKATCLSSMLSGVVVLGVGLRAWFLGRLVDVEGLLDLAEGKDEPFFSCSLSV